MKKPNEFYRKRGGKKSYMGAAFYAVHHPVRTLRSMFGFDPLGRDAAEGIEVGKSGYFKAKQILDRWGQNYRNPLRLTSVFRIWNTPKVKHQIPAPKPEID